MRAYSRIRRCYTAEPAIVDLDKHRISTGTAKRGLYRNQKHRILHTGKGHNRTALVVYKLVGAPVIAVVGKPGRQYMGRKIKRGKQTLLNGIKSKINPWHRLYAARGLPYDIGASGIFCRNEVST